MASRASTTSKVEVVGATPAISEAWLEPLLKAMRAVSLSCPRLPFRQRQRVPQSHGGEVIEQAAVEQTKSRPRHSNVGGIEKRRGDPQTHGIYAHRGATCRAHSQQHFNPYLNFHRPCGQPEIKTDAKGKQKRVYRYQTNLSRSCPRPPATQVREAFATPSHNPDNLLRVLLLRPSYPGTPGTLVRSDCDRIPTRRPVFPVLGLSVSNRIETSPFRAALGHKVPVSQGLWLPPHLPSHAQGEPIVPEMSGDLSLIPDFHFSFGSANHRSCLPGGLGRLYL